MVLAVIVFIEIGWLCTITSTSGSVIGISVLTFSSPNLYISNAITIASLAEPICIPAFPARELSIIASQNKCGSLFLIFSTVLLSSNNENSGLLLGLTG